MYFEQITSQAISQPAHFERHAQKGAGLHLQALLRFRAFVQTFLQTFFAHLICPFNLPTTTIWSHRLPGVPASQPASNSASQPEGFPAGARPRCYRRKPRSTRERVPAHGVAARAIGDALPAGGADREWWQAGHRETTRLQTAPGVVWALESVCARLQSLVCVPPHGPQRISCQMWGTRTLSKH